MKFRYIFLCAAALGCLGGQAYGSSFFSAGSGPSSFGSGGGASFFDKMGSGLPFDKSSGISLSQSNADQYAAPVPVDNSIDENAYIIGGGDIFFISFTAIPSMRFVAAVDRDGNLYIPELGLITIGNVPLNEAKTKIREHLATLNTRNSEFYISLVKTKDATVSFTGRVRSPGSYEFPGTTRLLDAVIFANDKSLPSANDADLRQVRRTNGDSTSVYDLLAYLYKDDKTQNPYIQPGDQIRINPTSSSVFISGAISSPNPGFYPLKPGETLKDFLSMFTFDNTADTDNVIVFQPADNSKRTFTSAELDIPLRNQDAITIPVKKNHPGIYTVSIAGEIASPGHYPITENSTSARQLIDMAGGMKPTGNIEQAVVIRPIKNLPERFNSAVSQLHSIRPERGAAVSIASASLDYTIIRLILHNADKVMLESGDQIVIPKLDKFVYISGAVKNPGAYPFQQGRDTRHYIAQAGGLNNNADKTNIQVYLKYGDLVQNTEPRCIEQGSIIIVPTSTQYKLLSQVIIPLISAAATTLTVMLSIYSISTTTR